MLADETNSVEFFFEKLLDFKKCKTIVRRLILIGQIYSILTEQLKL